MIIYPFGTQDVSIPIGKIVNVSTYGSGAASIYVSTLPSNLPEQFDFSKEIRNTKVTYGPYGAIKTIRVSAGSDLVTITIDTVYNSTDTSENLVPFLMVGQYIRNGIQGATGLVQDSSGKGNHLIYTSNMVDATRDAAGGYFTTADGAIGSSAGFEVPISSFSPNTYNGGNNGDSIFVSSIINFVTQPTVLATLSGNCGNGNVNGFAWYTTATGNIAMYTKSAAGLFQRGSNSVAVGNNTDHRVSMFVDGTTKEMFCWFDGVLITNSSPLAATGALFTQNSPWWFGGGGLPGGDRETQACRWDSICIIKASSGQSIKSPQNIDMILRNHRNYILKNSDIYK